MYEHCTALHFFYKVKGTVSRLSKVYFISICQILAMKLNVCKENIALDLNDKTIALLQPLLFKVTSKQG